MTLTMIIWIVGVLESLLLAWSLFTTSRLKHLNPGTVGLQATLFSLLVCVISSLVDNAWANLLSDLFAGGASIGIGLYVAYQFVDRFNEKSNYVKHKEVRDFLRSLMCRELAKISASTTGCLSNSHLTEWTPEITSQITDILTDYTGEDRAVKLDLQLSKFVDELRNMDKRKEPFSKEQLLYFAESFDKHIF